METGTAIAVGGAAQRIVLAAIGTKLGFMPCDGQPSYIPLSAIGV